MRVSDLPTPALVVEHEALRHNLSVMAAALPEGRCRPHIKAHKTTALAKLQDNAGHAAFTCATIREIEGMAKAGLGQDLLLANEVLDADRLGVVVNGGARVTLAVDSDQTVKAAVAGGVREVLIDVNVGLPRCGCDPTDAGRLAEVARSAGLEVRGVMGYEGHVVGLESRQERIEKVSASMALLVEAHERVGGGLISAGGTGTYDINTWADEIQAGSYLLMDTAYDKLDLPFRQAVGIDALVISTNKAGWAVADCGLKALGMDHGNPMIDLPGASVRFCSDEHVSFSADPLPPVGERVRVIPAHVDPTIAYHDRMYLVDGDEVIETWSIDLRGW